MRIDIKAKLYDCTESAALEFCKSNPGHRAVKVEGVNMVVTDAEAVRMEAEGGIFAYIVRSIGSICLVPVNQD